MQERGSSQYEAMQYAFYNTKYSRDNFTIVIYNVKYISILEAV